MTRGQHKAFPKERKKHLIGLIILGLFIALLAILIRIASWYSEAFGTMAFSVVVYQLSTPLKGTSQWMIDSVVYEVEMGLLIAFAIFLPIALFDLMTFINDVCICLRLLRREKNLLINARTGKIICCLLKVAAVLTLTIITYRWAQIVGVTKFVREISQVSSIYEAEYVETADVDLVFPENPRNLVFLYIESMESTFADVDSGGEMDANYIPELTALGENNINFSGSDKLGGFHVYGIGFTMAGLLASSSGINYKIPVNNSLEQLFGEFLPGVTSLGDILEAHGYDNYFQCGSEGEFAGRDTYFIKHGDYEVKDLNQCH